MKADQVCKNQDKMSGSSQSLTASDKLRDPLSKRKIDPIYKNFFCPALDNFFQLLTGAAHFMVFYMQLKLLAPKLSFTRHQALVTLTISLI